jgi:hypothetical protein
MRVRVLMAVFGGLALIAAAMVSPQIGKAGDTFMTLGAGLKSCGTWTKERSEAGPGKYNSAAWVQGYITAFNYWNAGPKDTNHITEGIDLHGILAWIDNYCRDNPLEDVAGATANLLTDLRKRQGWGW